MPPRSRAFVAAVVAALCGIAGIAVGGYGIDLVMLRRPDFEYPTMMAMAIGGAVGWSLGLVIAWRRAAPRPPTSRGDVAMFLAGAAFVIWLAARVAADVRTSSFGPMIDEPQLSAGAGWRPVIATAYWVDATLAAMTLVALALTREAPGARRTAR
jgi:hypothetical protein